MINEMPMDIAVYLTQFMSERDILNFSTATDFNFRALALKRLESEISSLTIMSITSQIENGRQTLTNKVLGFKFRIEEYFSFHLSEQPSITFFDSDYLKEHRGNNITLWFGRSRHYKNDLGLKISHDGNMILVHFELILNAIGQ
eukprot:NODE_10_length_61504_cov_0.956502.p46 type:complete len:144 gc:universal NODE_10_length_61504_cov_0.956502:43577-43146(-)